MNIKEAIEKRFSVRAFTKEVPNMETIKEILKTAGTAPSGGNIQPWKVYVLNENAKQKTYFEKITRTKNNCTIHILINKYHVEPLNRFD